MNSGRALRILVIEDEATVRATIRRTLATFGSVAEADDGLAGLRAFYKALSEKAPYHLVTIDLQLPQIEGQMLLELMRGLESARRERIKAKMLMITGESSSDAIVEALNRGATAYVRKPFDPDELRRRVRALFGIPPPVEEAHGSPVRRVSRPGAAGLQIK